MHGGEWQTTEKGKPPTGVRRQELVFIGSGLNTLELEAALDGCLLTDAEVEQIEELRGDVQTTGAAAADSEPESEVDSENYALGHGGVMGSQERMVEGQGWWRTLEDDFPAFEVECCEDDPGCEDHSSAPRGAPKLRFRPGDRVLCNCGEWQAGIITGLWYREDEWPRGQYAPYQVRLDSGDMICAPNDADECIRSAGPTGKAPPLRFKPGDRVLCNCGAEWERGTITELYYREDTWPRGEIVPYQIKLDSGRMICAPSDIDECIKEESGERTPKRAKDAVEKKDGSK